MAHRHSTTSSLRRLLITMILNFVITIADVIGGILSGSLSLLSDALHNFSDGIAVIISYIAIRLNERPKNQHYTFGMKRAEILAAVINASSLIIICFFLFKTAYSRLISPNPIAGGLMVGVAGAGFLANVIGTLLLRKNARENMNIRASYLHLLSDAISSIAVITGGLFIYFFQIYWIDPVLTILISLYVLKESFSIIKTAVNMIMMGSPENISLADIKNEIESFPGIQNIHHVHVWRLNEREIHFEAHIEVEDMKVSETSQLLRQIENRLVEKFQISHVTLQFECGVCDSKTLI